MTKTTFELDKYLPYLVNRLGVKLVETFSVECARHGIDIRMWRVLAALNHQDGQLISALAAMTSIDISTLSRLLTQMQRRHLIERRRDGTDQRAVSIHRSATARRITVALLPVAQKLERRALGKISTRDGARLKQLLIEAYGNLSDG